MQQDKTGGFTAFICWTFQPENTKLRAPAALDADTTRERSVLLGATTRELGPTREAVIETAVQRIDLPHKHAVEAYDLAARSETNPRSVWGYVQGLTRLSQRLPWQDQRFALDQAASRLLATVD